MKILLSIEEAIQASQHIERAKNRTLRLLLSQLEQIDGGLSPQARQMILDHVNQMVREVYRVFRTPIER